MDLAIAITTAPRREPTFERAFVSLRQAGFNEHVHVFAEPGTFGPGVVPGDAQTSVHTNSSTRGCFRNWKRTCKRLLAWTSAPWFLIVQDDAIWQPDAAQVLYAKMQDRQAPRTGFLSLYASPTNVSKDFVDGWNECRAGWRFWGALALCLKRAAAEDLLRHERFRKHDGPKQVDAVVGASMLDMNRPSFVHVPSLVDHIGTTSTIGNDHGSVHGRRGYRFGGRP